MHILADFPLSMVVRLHDGLILEATSLVQLLQARRNLLCTVAWVQMPHKHMRRFSDQPIQPFWDKFGTHGAKGALTSPL